MANLSEERGRASWFLGTSLALLLATLVAIGTAIDISHALATDTENINTNTVVTDLLEAPSAASASDGMTSTIGWTATGDTYATGHRVYRATTSGGPYTQVAELPGLATTSYVDSPAAGSYFYTVRAFSGGWESTDSNEVEAHVGPVELLGSWQTGLTHNIAAGPGRTLVVIASNEEASSSSTPTISGLTYGGQAMTKAVSQTVDGSGRWADLEVWTLDEAGIAAATGTTIAPTWTTTPGSPLYTHATFARTNQANPTALAATGTATTHTPNPVALGSITPSDGDMVIVTATAGFTGSYSAAGSFTLGNTQDTATLTTALAAAYLSSDGSTVSPTLPFDDTTIWRQVAATFVLQTP